MKQKHKNRYSEIVALLAVLLLLLGINLLKKEPVDRIKQIKVTDTEYKYDVIQREKIINLIMKQTQTGLKKQGIISIPRCNILLPIFNSAYTKKGLNAGANYANRSETDPHGKIKPKMGEGNYGIAAHNFNDGKTAFSALQQYTNRDFPYIVNGKPRVNEWLKGTDVYLANRTGIFRYKITYQELVTTKNIQILNPNKKPQLTLVSCLYPTDEYKIITKANLIKTYKWDSVPDKIIKFIDLTHKKTNAHVVWWNPGKEEGI